MTNRLCIRKIILCISLVLLFTRSQAQQNTLYLQNKNYSLQIGMYDIFKTPHADIVMLGNSLTFQANWNELLNRTTIANRGIVSDNTTGYLHRLYYVYRLHPKICFIEGGVNDIYANEKVPNIVQNIIHIIDTLRLHNIIPILQSVVLVGSHWHDALEKNKEIAALNMLLSQYAREHAIEMLDINPQISRDGFLREDVTYDGVHLNALGYALWAPAVERILIKYNL